MKQEDMIIKLGERIANENLSWEEIDKEIALIKSLDRKVKE